MTAVDQILRPEPKRDRWGRYLIEGKPYTRVTTFASSIDDRFNLEKWKVRMTALGLTQRHDLFAQVAAHHDDKKKLDKLCDDAIEAAKGNAGANLGTALHSFTERVDLGEDVHIPAPWDKDVAAYLETLEAGNVHIDRKYVERIVVNHDMQIAGTFDRLVTVDGWELPLIADLKTGANLDFTWGAIAVQLACYANADAMYDQIKDKTAPMPPVDKRWALVIHLPAGTATCTLHLVDIAAGWEAAQLCAAVRDWRKRKDLAEAYELPKGETRGGYLRRRVEALRAHPDALAELARCWPIGCPTFKQSSDHTAEQLEQIALVITTVKAKFSLPFDETDNNHPTETSDQRISA